MRKQKTIIFILLMFALMTYSRANEENGEYYNKPSEYDNKNHPKIGIDEYQSDRADRELNFVYILLNDIYNEDGRKKLKIAQKTWIKFRDQAIESEISFNNAGGYPRQEAYMKSFADLTIERTEHLKRIIKRSYLMSKDLEYMKGINLEAKNALDKIQQWESEETSKEKKRNEIMKRNKTKKLKEIEENSETYKQNKN